MLVGKATELFLAKLARDGYKKSQEADRRQVPIYTSQSPHFFFPQPF